MPKLIHYPRVLVVDDVRDAAESFARLLHTMGCDATVVTDPRRAVETAQQIMAELVFLDLGMPGLDGYALARLLRAQHGWEGLRLVAMTGYGSAEDRARSRQAGFDAHLLKPASPELIESTVRTLFPGIVRR
jgi:CheY-like chemotaxis protein